MQSTCYQINNNVITLKLYIQPGSKKNEVIGLFEGALKIKLGGVGANRRNFRMIFKQNNLSSTL